MESAPSKHQERIFLGISTCAKRLNGCASRATTQKDSLKTSPKKGTGWLSTNGWSSARNSASPIKFIRKILSPFFNLPPSSTPICSLKIFLPQLPSSRISTWRSFIRENIILWLKCSRWTVRLLTKWRWTTWKSITQGRGKTSSNMPLITSMRGQIRSTKKSFFKPRSMSGR